MLKTAGFSLPHRVHIHGFLTVGGEKMSKSKGTFVKAETYLRHLDPSYLRYYYASKLGSRLDDIDLNLPEFVAKVNADLVGKVVNLASRTAKFAARSGLSAAYPNDGGLFQRAADSGEAIANAYELCDYNRAMRLIMELADRANPYVEAHEPWNLAKRDDHQRELQDVCTVALNLFRQIAVYLAPVLPRLAEQTSQLLNVPITHWNDASRPLLAAAVSPFVRMLDRVDPAKVDAMIEESKEDGAAGAATGAGPSDPFLVEPLADQISIDEFAKVDLRVAEVLAAEDVPEAKKLLKITLGLGGDQRRIVFAGIKEAYDPAKLVGRHVIVVANLAPRKMKFGVSEGMIVATGTGGSEVFLLSPDAGATPGQRVH
jgi:methionyl-tRNA synthetase